MVLSDAGLFVGGDERADEQGFVAANDNERFGDGALSGAQGFDLAADQEQARFEFFENFVFKSGLAIDDRRGR